jgi:2'-5' RNA ligase
MKTRKLFIAIATHEGLEESAAAIVKKLRINADQKELEVRWVPEKNYHVTLHFLGNTSPEKIPQIEEMLAGTAASVAPFKLKISGLGAFPDDMSSRVLWFGVQNSKALRHLQGQIAEKFSNFSYNTRDDHEYSPHLTIGRLRNPHRTRDLLSPFVRKSLAKIDVTEIVLFESVGAAPFPVYKVVKAFPLTGETEIVSEEADPESAS